MKTVHLDSDTRVLNQILENALKMNIPVAMVNGKLLHRRSPNVFGVVVDLIVPEELKFSELMS